MRIVTWTVRLVLFVLLVALAAKNTDPVTVRFYFDLALETPLVVALFGAFLAGALVGVLAPLGTVLRHKREIASLRREARAHESRQAREEAKPPLEAGAGSAPPLPPI